MRDALAAQETEERKLSITKIQGNEVVVFFFRVVVCFLRLRRPRLGNMSVFIFADAPYIASYDGVGEVTS